jgi:cellulose synthase/poly-beta-1,6-N-acetylglucosamine synthase-like glycosyltransferase
VSHLALSDVISGVAWLSAALVIGVHLLTLIMILVATSAIGRARSLLHGRHRRVFTESPVLPPVTAVVPAFNEQDGIVRTVRSLLALNYPRLSVVVVSDGSTDETLLRLDDAFHLVPKPWQAEEGLPTEDVRAVFQSRSHPTLTVVDKANGGKADALNCGLNHATGELVLALDADVVLQSDSLALLALPLAEDPLVVAAGGTVWLHEGARSSLGSGDEFALPTRWLEAVQSLEYLRAFAIGRLFYDRLNSLLIISGAFGLFRRDALLSIGGYQPHAIGEDMEVVVRLHRHYRARRQPYRIASAPFAACFTEAPHSLRELGRQRVRWQQGLMSTLRAHRAMAFDAGSGAVGWIAYPMFWLEQHTPWMELGGWAVLATLLVVPFLPTAQVVGYASAALLAGTASSLAAILVGVRFFAPLARPADTGRLCLMAFVEHLGFRQAVAWFRIRGILRYYRGVQLKTAWVSPSRTGSGKPGV